MNSWARILLFQVMSLNTDPLFKGFSDSYYFFYFFFPLFEPVFLSRNQIRGNHLKHEKLMSPAFHNVMVLEKSERNSSDVLLCKPRKSTLGPFIRGKIRSVLHKTRLK